jgi:HK97 gp10 family phage protein
LRDKVIAEASRVVVKMFAEEARRRASSAVANSIKIIRLRDAESPGNVVYLVSAGGKGGRVAHLLEFGTSKHPIAPNADARKRRNKYRNEWVEVLNRGTTDEKRISHKAGAHIRTTGRMMLRLADNFVPRLVHHGSKPHPFMRPAFDANVDGAIDAFVKEAAKLIEELGAKA